MNKTNIRTCDVLVAGGGTAGWPAALAAARMGKKVVLVESRGFVGGTINTGLPMHGFFGDEGRQVVAGLADELVRRLVAEGYSDGYHHTDLWFNAMVTYNGAAVKPILFTMLREAGVELMLSTDVARVVMDNGAVRGLEVNNRSGRFVILAGRVIDATGDAAAAEMAGAAMQPPSSRPQPPSLVFRLENVDIDALRDFLAANPSHYHTYRLKPGRELTEQFLRTTHFFFLDSSLMGERHYKGDYDPVIDRIMFTIVPGARAAVFNMLRALRIDCLDADSMSRAAAVCYENLLLLAKDLRKVPGFRDSYLCDSEPDIQLRESRRIKGKYTLAGKDIEAGARSADDIALGSYFIDMHSSDSSHGTWIRLDKTYGIPYRALLPESVENLIVAGRCASGDEVASASFRVIGTCMAMGQAAGAAAALSLDAGVAPSALDPAALRDSLRNAGAIVE